MRVLTHQEVENVDGGIIPAMYAGFLLYNYAVGVYGGATVAAWSAGALTGAALVFAAEQ